MRVWKLGGYAMALAKPVRDPMQVPCWRPFHITSKSTLLSTMVLYYLSIKLLSWCPLCLWLISLPSKLQDCLWNPSMQYVLPCLYVECCVNKENKRVPNFKAIVHELMVFWHIVFSIKSRYSVALWTILCRGHTRAFKKCIYIFPVEFVATVGHTRAFKKCIYIYSLLTRLLRQSHSCRSTWNKEYLWMSSIQD